MLRRWTGVPEVGTVEAAGRWIAGEAARRNAGRAIDLVVHRRDDPDRVLGEIGLVWTEPGDDTVEAGWWVTEPARGAGLAPAALRLVTTWALTDLGLASLTAVTDPANPASGRVAERAGWSGPEPLDDGRLRWTARDPA